jgi:hypothetical protein
MTFIYIALIIGAAVAQQDKAQPEPVKISVVVVHATKEDGKKQYDASLDKVRPALADLEFDRYEEIRSVKMTAPFNEETIFDLTSGYKLCVSPLSREQNGQARINLKVQLDPKEPGGPPVNALNTTIAIGPGKQFKLRGLTLDRGELVVVISIEK